MTKEEEKILTDFIIDMIPLEEKKVIDIALDELGKVIMTGDSIEMKKRLLYSNEMIGKRFHEWYEILKDTKDLEVSKGKQ